MSSRSLHIAAAFCFVRTIGRLLPVGTAMALAFISFVQPARAQSEPSILTQPFSLTRGLGGTASFSVNASGLNPLSYQWQMNSTNLPGATNATLVITNTQLKDAGDYFVTITNTAGSTNSLPATLTILPGLAVTLGNANGTWTLANSPYVVETNITATNLTIVPGVSVLFAGPCQLEVIGTFSAAGTSDAPIQFTAAPGASNWDGIYFNSSTGAVDMDWCVVEKSTNSGIRIHNCSPVLSHCMIRQNSAFRGGGIATDSPLTLQSCEIVSNQVNLLFLDPVPPPEYLRGGGVFSSGGLLTLRGCHVLYNTMHSEVSDYPTTTGGGGIYATGSCVIEDCEIVGNTLYSSFVNGARSGAGGGAFCGGSLVCSGSTISSNETCMNWSCFGAGVSVDGTGVFTRCVLEGNVLGAGEQAYGGAVHAPDLLHMTNCLVAANRIGSCNTTPWMWGGAIYGNNGEIQNCTIAFNSQPSVAFPEQAAVQFQGTIQNSIIFFNTSAAQIGPEVVSGETNGTVVYSDVQGGATGINNLATDPGFVNTTNLLLTGDSLCIDAGDPSAAFNDVSFPPSQGGARNDMGAYGGPFALSETSFGAPLVLFNGAGTPPPTLPGTNVISISMQTSFTNGHIFYTTDGSDPNAGAVYTTPFNVTVPATIRAVAYDSTEINAAYIAPIPLIYYSLTASAPGGGTVSANPPAGPYLANSSVALMETNNSGWSFLNWAGDASGSNAAINLLMNSPKSVQAVFGTTLVTTVPAGGGTISANSAPGPFPYGSQILISALPDSGHYWVRWGGAAFGMTGNPLSFTVTNANPTVSAVFASLPSTNFTLATLIDGDGSINVSPQASYYTNGQSVTLTAMPNGNSAFEGWSGDLSGTANPAQIEMTANKVITAHFTSNSPSNPPPDVAITNPVSGATFTALTSIAIDAVASDINGTVTQVVFLSGTNELAAFTDAPYHFVWTNAPAGTNLLAAIATDNDGASSTSAPVAITVNLPPPGPPVFSLSSGSYSVLENGGSVTVTVLKNFNSVAATMNYTTSDGSAVAVSGGVGDYYPASGSLSFSSGETSKTVTISIVDDIAYEGNQQFTFALSLFGGNGSLTNPSSATITILDNDVPATTNSFLDVLFPTAVPPHDGQLRVSLQPTNSGGQWRLAWETAWRNSGDVIGGLPTGNYEVEFRPVANYLAPNNTTNPVLAGQLTSVTNQYVLNGAPQFGSLSVELLPNTLTSQAQWRLQGDSQWHDSGFVITNLPAGEHIIEFKSVADWVAPAPRVVLVGADQADSISATYLLADASGGTPPSVLQFSDATTPLSHQPPYPWTGQLLSDSGYGSGTVVRRRVVLTAAHVVFDDSTLSYVTRVRWFFQRYKGEFEPPVQTPRGWYVFSGYAAARTNDNSPGVSSPASQNLDVAALYFLEDAGRGGQSGYLVSEPGGTEWLQTSALKTLIGYPVEVVSELNRGKLHATLPGNLSFAQVTNRVFSTSGILGYPGMSGGPLCVQYTDGTYYPAAVYLGGSGQTIVRAIDGAVADLINRADVSANTGDNNTGGGVVLLSSGAGTLFAPGNFQIILGPPEALAAGAGWRITQLTNANYFNDNSATYALPAAAYTLTFRPVFGFLTPIDRTLQIVANQTAVLNINYINLAPQGAAPLLTNGIPQITFTAPAGYEYVIERSTNLSDWIPVETNFVSGDGTIRFLETNLMHSAFYRARLIP